MVINVVESNMTGKEHSSFNAAILVALSLICQDAGDEIHLWAEDSHYENIRAIYKNNIRSKIVYHQIKVISGSRRQFFRKIAVEVKNIFLILGRCRREGGSVIFLSTFAPTTALLMLLRVLFRRTPTHLILHGIDGLIRKDKQRLNSYGLWNRLALLRLYKGVWPNVYVLGRGIRNRLLNFFPDAQFLSSIRYIEHPYEFTRNDASENSIDSSMSHIKKTINVGFIGYGRKDKGIDLFYALAEKMSDYVREGVIRFLLVGSLDPKSEQYVNCWVDRVEDDGVCLSAREAYQKAIGELDCALMLGSQAYKLTASGSVLDIIDAGIKIISLPNDYVADIALMDEENGITIVKNMEEVEAMIKEYSASRKTRKYRYARIRDYYGVACLAQSLQKYL